MSEKIFIKAYDMHLAQIERSLGDMFKPHFLKIFNEVVYRMDKSNHLEVTAKNIKTWGVSDRVSRKICAELSRIGFWVKYKRSKYMVNPRVLNRLPADQLPRLIGIYDNYKGLEVVFDAYIKARADFKEKIMAEKIIEIEVQKIYEETVNTKLREENKMNADLVKSLTKQLEVKDKQIAKLMALLSPEQLVNAPKLTLVGKE